MKAVFIVPELFIPIIILAIVFSVSFWYVAIKPMNYWKRKCVKQGNPSWFFGDVLRVLLRRESFPEFVDRIHKQCSGVRYSGMYQLTSPTLLIHDPDLIKQILINDFDHFVDHRTIIPEENDPLWSKNLFALKGERWKHLRLILSPQFSTRKMRSMFLLITECVDVFMENLSKNNKEIIEVDMREMLARLGIDVIASIAFGLKVDSISEPDNDFYMMGREATDLNGFWTSLTFFGYQLLPKLYEMFKIRVFSRKVTNFFENLVNKIIKLREEHGIESKDLIQLLLDARKNIKRQRAVLAIEAACGEITELATIHEFNMNKYQITNTDIASQAMVFFFGGFEPVAGTMSFMIYELALNQTIQEKLRQEVLGIRKKCGGKVTYDALMNMDYMDMVVTETLRKWPQVVQLDRICTKPYTIEPKYPGEKPVHLEVGDLIWIPVYGIHHDPKYYPDPKKFDPERFSEGNKHFIHSCHYIPFGVGPRNCLGARFAVLEVKTLMFHLLSNFQIVPTSKTTIPEKIVKGSINVLIDGGFNVGLKSLNN